MRADFPLRTYILSLLLVIALIVVAMFALLPAGRTRRGRGVLRGWLQALIDERVSEIRAFRSLSSERYPSRDEVPPSARPRLRRT
jgi:hypothetical protein